MANNSSPWYAFERGNTIGQRGSEEGTIIRDEEHPAGARITLERLHGRASPFAITCGFYGWFFHTRYCSSEEGDHDFEAMRTELTRIIDLLASPTPGGDDGKPAVLKAISDFVDKFPT